MAKSSQHFYPGSARVSRAGDRVLAITNFELSSSLNQTNNVLFDSAKLVAWACPALHDIAKYSGDRVTLLKDHTEVSLCAASFFYL